MIVPKQVIDLFAISALTSVTYSLSSLTISYIFPSEATCARISSLRFLMYEGSSYLMKNYLYSVSKTKLAPRSTNRWMCERTLKDTS